MKLYRLWCTKCNLLLLRGHDSESTHHFNNYTRVTEKGFFVSLRIQGNLITIVFLYLEYECLSRHDVNGMRYRGKRKMEIRHKGSELNEICVTSCRGQAQIGPTCYTNYNRSIACDVPYCGTHTMFCYHLKYTFHNVILLFQWVKVKSDHGCSFKLAFYWRFGIVPNRPVICIYQIFRTCNIYDYISSWS